MNNAPVFGDDNRRNFGLTGLLGLLLAIFMVAGLGYVFEPRWETDDDLAMAMVAHGFGIAAHPSPTLVFSNVVWGRIVQAFPSIHGILGYSLASLSALILASTVMINGLMRAGVGALTAGLVVLCLIARPAVFPQFTLNAGLLTVAAIMVLDSHAREPRAWTVLLFPLLAWLAFLIRSQEFILVLLMGLALLPWRFLSTHRPTQIAIAVLVLAIIAAKVLDAHAYSSPDWNAFQTLNLARAPLTDFGAGQYLKARPDILQRFGYSRNDLELVENWFFVDPEIANPKRLTDMLAALGALPVLAGNVGLVAGMMGSLLDTALLPLSVLAVGIGLMNPDKKTLLSWGLLMLLLLALGLSGRTNIMRVYLPLLALLTVMPLLERPLSRHKRLAMTVLAVFCASWNLVNLSEENRETRHIITETQKFARLLLDVNQTHASWCGGLPIEYVYPVFGQDVELRNIKLYPFGVFTFAPFSRAFQAERQGEGFLARLVSPNGISLMASAKCLALLDNYCQAHLQQPLQTASVQSYFYFKVAKANCAKPTQPVSH